MTRRFTEIDYLLDGSIATITLARPVHLNAFTPTMALELIAALDEADGDEDIRVILVTGQGGAFCAGRDLSGGASTFDRARDMRAGVPPPPDLGGTVTLRILRSHKPVIAAINGVAVGAGLSITLGMDIRIASDNARFGLPFARRGIVPEGCSSWLLPRLVGLGRALEWMETGRIFAAQEALAAGLVTSIHSADRLLDEAQLVASDLARGTSAVSLALMRRAVLQGLELGAAEDAHALESEMMNAVGSSADAQEGVSSFLEKRPPSFQMRVPRDLPAAIKFGR